MSKLLLFKKKCLGLLHSIMQSFHGHDTNRDIHVTSLFSALHVWKCCFLFMSMNSLLPPWESPHTGLSNIIEFSNFSLRVFLSCSQAVWSDWNGEDTLPGDGVCKWRWECNLKIFLKNLWHGKVVWHTVIRCEISVWEIDSSSQLPLWLLSVCFLISLN